MDIIIRARRSLMKKVEHVQNSTAGLTELTASLDLVDLRLDDIRALEAKLDANHQQISEGCDDKAYSMLEAELKASFLTVDTIKIRLSSLKAKLTPAATTQPTAPPRTTADVKLPKLELPTFSGDFMDWITFKDRFEASIHNHASLRGAEKLTYLVNALEGEPKGMVKSYSISDANYIEAWNALNSRYQSEREIVSAILKKLFAQPPMKEEDATALRKLIDVTGQCIRSLKGLKLPVDTWDAILVHLMFEKLDGETRRQWELSLKTSSIPKFEDFNKFLEIRSRSLAVMTTATKPITKQAQSSKPASKSVNHGSKANCCICEKDHAVHVCPSFVKLSIPERLSMVKSKKLCFNCLRSNHRVTDCKSESRCKKCSRNHHSMIHLEKRPEQSKTDEPKDEERKEVNHAFNANHEVLLGTAIILLRDVNGEPTRCRAMLDPGSQATLVSEECIRRLGIYTNRVNSTFSGVGGSDVARSKRTTTLEMITDNSSFKASIYAYVLSKVTQEMPRSSFVNRQWTHTRHLKLADPSFNQKSPIDVLLGADVVALILKKGLKKGPEGTPIAQETEYGWVLSGSVLDPTSGLLVNHVTRPLEDLVERFWKIEHVAPVSRLTTEEKECEDFFMQTTTRGSDGRFTVTLPFKSNTELGASRKIAERRFLGLEKKLMLNPALHQQYADVIQEYVDLGQLSVVSKEHLSRPESITYYVPHHGVFKEASQTTKLRVVFDASAKTSNGKSLNDVLKCGPKIQDDLIPILMRFRNYQVPIIGDAEKMYRMVKVSPDNYHYQRILWRKSPNEPIQDYEMSVLMFGEKPAPWLATRTVQELAHQEQENFPLASKVMQQDLYVDDLISGGSSAEEVKLIRNQVQDMMKSGGFLMRKWVCPDESVMLSIPENLRGAFNTFEISNDASVKTLGIQWSPTVDEFSFTVNPSSPKSILTKRFILSETSKIFDPLGWLSPTIIRAKILLQTLWSEKVGWDDPVPAHLAEEWMDFSTQLPQLQKVKIPRKILLKNYDTLELHGFSDASEAAYGAVVYLKSVNAGGSQIRLVASKTRVAPLSPPQSIPKLELSGALLLTKLMELVTKSLKLSVKMYAWTDSMIVLCWLRGEPTRWKTFIANRVGEIQSGLPYKHWGHVASEENPADVCSRGTNPVELIQHSLWWTGPHWLSSSEYPQQPLLPGTTLEERKLRVHLTSTMDKYSSYSKLLRITAWVKRLLSNMRLKSSERVYGHLSVQELRTAEKVWIKIIQTKHFNEEVTNLKFGRALSVKSKLLPLAPFLDDKGILRVGGRLQKSNLSYDAKHPMLLPAKDILVERLVEYEHQRLLHAGPDLLMSHLRRRFWIINARMLVRKTYNKCVTCVRHRGSTLQQIMGSLPTARVSSQRVFMKTGVDFAGPFLLRVMKGRGQKRFKSYVCIFICMSTRAMHIDLVSDLSTEAFLAALRRFVSRRGKPVEIWSDNGTNFVGANRELREMSTFLNNQKTQEAVTDHLSSEGIQWRFNPPGAPHFGGMWEAGVKSVKYHLRRIMGNVVFTFEEMCTALTQIEACLNSRPICPLSTDLSDLDVLTPGHFLIGTALTAVPDEDLLETQLNRLNRWQLIQRTVQHFWRRWSREFLSRLQQRPKWWVAQPNLKEGAIVLIKDDNLPPLKWKMGRVIQVHPDSNDQVRVATIRTAQGEVRRPVVKLSLLPLDTQEESSE